MRHLQWLTGVILAAGVGSAQMASPTATGSPAAVTPGRTMPSTTAHLSSMLDQSPVAPDIEFNGGFLTIHATNSSLRSILDTLQSRTGTQIQGLVHDERVFGVYGPGRPQEVLSALLDDSGYNVLISGVQPNGSPREVVLSTRTVVASEAGAGAQPTQAAQENDDESEGFAPQAPPLGLPTQNPAPTPTVAPAANVQVKTPQQMLQELMHQAITQGQTTGQTTPQ